MSVNLINDYEDILNSCEVNTILEAEVCVMILLMFY